MELDLKPTERFYTKPEASRVEMRDSLTGYQLSLLKGAEHHKEYIYSDALFCEAAVGAKK
jgi:hypothetical protein